MLKIILCYEKYYLLGNLRKIVVFSLCYKYCCLLDDFRKVLRTNLAMKSTVLWFMTPCSLLDVRQRFGRECCIHIQSIQNGGSMLLRNVCNFLPDHNLSMILPRRAVSKPFNFLQHVDL
jgi:hypothetical protein